MPIRFHIPPLGRALWVLLGGVLFTHLGSYMLLPFFAVILSGEKGLTLGQVGLVLGAGSIAYLSGSLLGGFFADRLGRKTTMVGGLLLRAAALLTLLFMNAFPLLLLLNLVAGLGSGLYMPAAKAGIAAFAEEGSKATIFSYRGIAANIGVTVGPLLGTLLLRFSSLTLFSGAAIVYGGLALAHVFLLEKECKPGVGDCPQPAKIHVRDILSDRPFLAFSLVTVFVWALFTQFTLSLPLRAQQIDVVQNIGLIWTATSVVIILLQSPITRFLSGRLHPLHAMGLGTAVMAVGLGTVALSSQFWHLVGSALLFTLGEMLVMPTSDAVVSDLAKPERVGTYFGIASFAFGAGETIGNIGGGQLMETAVQLGRQNVPWLLFGAIGLVVGGAYYLLSLWRPLARPLAAAPVTEAPNTQTNPLLKRKGKV